MNLHTAKISDFSSKIAKNIYIRNILKDYQKNFIKKTRVV